jgi:hypothetical protein
MPGPRAIAAARRLGRTADANRIRDQINEARRGFNLPAVD